MFQKKLSLQGKLMKYKAKKRFGQNFLKDKAILNKIIEIADIDDSTLVIEIGPGQGALTEGLVKTAPQVIAYEIDFDLIKYLKLHFREFEQLEIIEGDFLKRDIESDRLKYQKNFNKTIVVANIPYYITSPIITKLLTEYQNLDKAVIMVQEEVARRFTASIKTKDYSALTVITQYYAKVDYALSVPRDYFHPIPKVDSAVISITPLKNKSFEGVKEKAFINFIKHSFSQKRKTWINNLLNHYSLSKENIEQILKENGLDKSVRSEAVPLEVFKNVFEIFFGDE